MQLCAAGSIGYVVQDLVRLGVETRVVSMVSGDPLGLSVIEALKQVGLDTSHIGRKPGTAAGIGVYMLLFGSRKRPLAYRLPDHEPWPKVFSQEDVDYLLRSSILHCGGYLHFPEMYGGSTADLYRRAKRKGLITSIDTQFPLVAVDLPWIRVMQDILPFTDILFVDEHEGASLTGLENPTDIAAALRAAGISLVVVKQGSKGAWVDGRDRRFFQPAITVGELVDSIGAGDAFDSAFLTGILEGWPLERTARFAATVAGFTVTGVGGTSAMPTREQAERHMVAEGSPPAS